MAEGRMAGASTTSQSGRGEQEQATLTQLMDPYKYSLKHVYIRPDLARLPLGVTTTTSATGVVEITAVAKGAVGEQYGMEVGMYLLCANGRMCTGEPSDLKPNESGMRMTLVKKRRYQWNPRMPLAFLGRYRRQPSCEYFLTRVNLIKCRPSAFAIVAGKGTVANIGVGSDRAALAPFGLHIGDGIVAVDYFPPRDKQHCEALLRAAQNDVIDFTIERAPVAFIPVIKVKVPDTTASFSDFSLSDDDDSSSGGSTSAIVPEPAAVTEDLGLGLEEEFPGDPAMGIPPVPADVLRLLKSNARELARKIVTAKATTTPRPAPVVASEPPPLALSSEPDQRAKLVKSVKKTKLKKAPPPLPPKK